MILRQPNHYPTGLFQPARFVLFFIASTVFFSSSLSYAMDEPLVWNAKADIQTCPTDHSAVWAEYETGAECIRYFSSGGIDNAPLVFVRMYGDRTASMQRAPSDIPDNTAEAQQAIAERRAKQLGIPMIILARPGTYGSSGDHRARRQKSEFLALDSALNEIMRKYQIDRLVLSGHSGGATAAAALMTLGRDDISCAILTSGAYDLLERAQRLREQRGNAPRPGLDLTGFANPYDPIQHIAGVVDDPERIILVIGNPNDTNTPFDLQERFATALANAGHHVRLIEQPAQGPDFHNLRGDIGYRAIERCHH